MTKPKKGDVNLSSVRRTTDILCPLNQCGGEIRKGAESVPLINFQQQEIRSGTPIGAAGSDFICMRGVEIILRV